LANKRKQLRSIRYRWKKTEIEKGKKDIFKKMMNE
jgi:hypothetical protein